MKLLVGLQLHFGYDLTPTTDFESYTDFKNRGECRLNDRFKRILKFNQKDINTR